MVSPCNSQWVTLKTLIDKRLRGEGRRVVPFDPVTPLDALESCAVEEFQMAHGSADYALVLGGRVVGVVEARKLTLGPQNVAVQAERYSNGVAQDGFGWGCYRPADTRLDKFTQEVLSNAFGGEPFPTEAELANAEGRIYETANERLDRIRKSQAAAPARSRVSTKRA